MIYIKSCKVFRILFKLIYLLELIFRAHKANSHSQIGWQKFTDSIIKFISTYSKKTVVFLLWGAFAHKKENLIDLEKHKIIKVLK